VVGDTTGEEIILADSSSMLLETGIFMSQAIWLWRVRHVRKEAKKAGKTYDEYIAENPSKKIPRSESSETVVDVEAGHEPQCQTETSPTGSNEKQDTASKSESISMKEPAITNTLMDKWRNLVLRPTPNAS
jgi:hypothetical protein